MKKGNRKNVAELFCAFILLLVATVMTGCGNKKDNNKSNDVEQVNANTQHITPHQEAGGLPNTQHLTPNTQPEDTTAARTSKEPEEKSAKPDPVHMGMWGHVGGTGFLFDMNGNTGSYIPYDMAEAKEYGERRQLKLVSYDPKSGSCVINAYIKEQYIGQFKGTFNEEEVEMDEGGSHYFQSYDGIFTSAKGAKLDFHFHFD